MKLFIIVTILATSHLGNYGIAADDDSGTGVICEPHKKFYVDDINDRGCKICICSDDGKSANCTRQFCPVPKPIPSDSRQCTPGTTFRVGCQRCRCSEDGYTVASCTGRPAPPGCKPGETTRVDCNTCTCTPERVFLCTKFDCLHTTTVIPTMRPSKCIPGKPVIIDCNSCGCNPDGTIGFCTQHTCPVLAYD